MSKNIKVSLIIPAYNVEKYINDCIYSLFHQSYKNLEIIIVDDGSVDGTPYLVDKLAKKDIRVKVVHQQNGGLPAARNTGLKVATGDCIMFLDADDWLEKDCCLIAVEEMLKNKVDVIIFDYFKEFRNNTIVHCSYKQKQLVYNKDGINNFFIYDMRTITVWGKLYSRKCLENILFDEKMRTAEDVDFNYRVYNNIDSAIYIQRPLLHYRILEKSAIHGYDSKIIEKFEYPLRKIHKFMVEGYGDKEKIQAYFSFASIAYILACQNGICLDSKLSIMQKKMQISKLREKSYVKELFLNIGKVRVPLSRKLLIIMGKFHLDIAIIMIIALKQKVEKMR